MALTSFHHIETLTVFNKSKFAFDSLNTKYFVGRNYLTILNGEPDFKYEDIVFIKPLALIYTHGRFYTDNSANSVYGVSWSGSSPDCTRIGNMDCHKSLPVQSQMVGGLMTDDGTFTPFSNQDDWTNETRDGSKGQVMVKIPEHYVKFEVVNGVYFVYMSALPVEDFKTVPEMYVSAYEAALDQTDPTTPKLASVVNTSAEFRGGHKGTQTTTKNWDSDPRSQLGKPITGLTLEDFRTYARNRNNGDTRWNAMMYEAQRALYWLFVVEYATLNSQAVYNAQLTTDGYHQGGLSAGISNISLNNWINFFAYGGNDSSRWYYPFVSCGFSDEYGNQTVAKLFPPLVRANRTYLSGDYVPRYRGIENPFGHIWQWTDGISCYYQNASNRPLFACTNPAAFRDSVTAADDDYYLIGNDLNAQQYVKEIHFGENGEITAKTGNGTNSTYYCDYHWTNVNTWNGARVVAFGGRAGSGAYCGFVYSDTFDVPSHTLAYVGSRLCFKP